PVLVVGADALRAEVRAVGLRPVTRSEEGPAAVVQGYAAHVGWVDLAEAVLAVRAGAFWVATNTDRTLPSPRGPLPGNGALVAAVRTALDREPDLVVGKPEPALFTTAARRFDAERPLVVGDRLDTDIEGAVRAGMDSLLVLTGVSSALDLLQAPAALRPTYVAFDIGGLFAPDRLVRVADETGATGADDDWRAVRDGASLVLTGQGGSLDALAALCGAAWSGDPVTGVVPGTAGAEAALRELDLLP
ncbi:MAG TPA: HAD hydrolase-like protein, partial [Micromonospora sp.]